MVDLPKLIDISLIPKIGVLVLAVIQYFKSYIPDKLIPIGSIVAGIIISFLYLYKVPIGSMDFVAVVANGVLGAIMADTGYQFFSKKDGNFSLPPKNNK